MSFRLPTSRTKEDLDDTSALSLARPAKRAIYGRRPAIRTLDTIAHSDAFDLDPYRPAVHKDYAVEKLRLQASMTNNGAPVSPAAEGSDGYEDDAMGTGTRPLRRGRHGRSSRATDDGNHQVLDEFDMLMGEITERRQWLDDMVAMGHGDAHKRQISSEISQRIQRLEKIDAERSKHAGVQRKSF
ncbi:hypothetical protein HKX48_008513 [Thoreauomyces humboldtii]|nr:hypothetical protein HKX48_008513 [Thoreauomyces humboldtii]